MPRPAATLSIALNELAGPWTKSASERGSVTRSIVICKKRVELLRKLHLQARFAAGHRPALRLCQQPWNELRSRIALPLSPGSFCASVGGCQLRLILQIKFML